MSQFTVNILGCGSAFPTKRHQPSSQVIDFRGNLFMIDCGENAQTGMRRAGLTFSRLNHIFISHLHGDHCFGLPGLLSTMGLQMKTGTVNIYMFQEGIDVFKPFIEWFCRDMPFAINYIAIPHGERAILFESDSLTVESFPLYHRVPCSGFIFREKPKKRHLKGDMLDFYNVPIAARAAIKDGADFTTADGKVIENSRLTSPADPSMSYAYCSDTMMDRRVADAVRGVDVIYHEATYTSDLEKTARERGHSTARQAAETARSAGASRLVIGHYSKRYVDETPLLEEAREVFPDVILANEGLKIKL